MTRRGIGQEAIDAVRTAYRRLYCEPGAAMSSRVDDLRREFPSISEVHGLCDAVLASSTGVHGRARELARPDDKRTVPAMWQPQSATRPEGASAPH